MKRVLSRVRDVAVGVSVLVAMLAAAPEARAQSCDPFWSGAFAEGLNGAVHCLHVFDDGAGPALYAGGEFTMAGGVPVAYVAKWDGSSWSAVGMNLDGPVLALATFDAGRGEELFAAGFGLVGGGQSVARWDGTAWRTTGAPFGWSGFLAVYEGELYTSGGWILPDGTGYIARWNGRSPWRGVADGQVSVTHDGVEWVQDGKPVLVIAGGVMVPEPLSFGVVAWDGTAWLGLGGGVNGNGDALAVHDDGTGRALYVGGTFTRAGTQFGSTGGVAASNVARWDGSAWSALGTGLNAPVHDLEVFDDGSGAKVYASGPFTLAGSTSVTRIAVWDGASWSALGAADSGITGVAPAGYEVDAAAMAGFAAPDDPARRALYVGGLFQFTGGAAANNLGARVARQRADLNGDGLVDFADYLEFLNLFDAGDPRADFNGDGLVDFADYLEFLNLLDEGC